MVTRRPATGSTSGADQRDETTLHRTGVAGVATPPAAPAPLTKRSARAFPAPSFFCFVFFSFSLRPSFLSDDLLSSLFDTFFTEF